jgi:hypothetical protein
MKGCVILVLAAVVCAVDTLANVSSTFQIAEAPAVPVHQADDYITWYNFPCIIGTGINCSYGPPGWDCDTFPNAQLYTHAHLLSTSETKVGGGTLWAIGASYVQGCAGKAIFPGNGRNWGTVLTSNDIARTWNVSANSSLLTNVHSSAVVQRVNASDGRGGHSYQEAVCILGGYAIADDLSYNVSYSVACAWESEPSIWTPMPQLPAPTYDASAVSYHGQIIVIGGWRQDASTEVWASTACTAWPCAIVSGWQVILPAAPCGYRMSSSIIASSALGKSCGSPADPTRSLAPTAIALISGLDPSNPAFMGQDIWLITDPSNVSTWVEMYNTLPVYVDSHGELALSVVEFPAYAHSPWYHNATLPIPSTLLISGYDTYTMQCGGTAVTPIVDWGAWFAVPEPTNGAPHISSRSLPLQTTADGLPTGLMIVSTNGDGFSVFPAACELCPPEYLSQGCKMAPSENRCTRCRVCTEGTYTVSNCTVSNDAWCYRCSTCDIGTYIVSNCSQYFDTQCAACQSCVPPVSYLIQNCSNTSNTVCGVCSACPAGSVVVQPCTFTQDTVCSVTASEGLQWLHSAYFVVLGTLLTAAAVTIGGAPHFVRKPIYTSTNPSESQTLLGTNGAVPPTVPTQPTTAAASPDTTQQAPGSTTSNRCSIALQPVVSYAIWCRQHAWEQRGVKRLALRRATQAATCIYFVSAMFASLHGAWPEIGMCVQCSWACVAILVAMPFLRLFVCRYALSQKLLRAIYERKLLVGSPLSRHGGERGSGTSRSWMALLPASFHFRSLQTTLPGSMDMQPFILVELVLLDIPLAVFCVVQCITGERACRSSSVICHPTMLCATCVVVFFVLASALQLAHHYYGIVYGIVPETTSSGSGSRSNSTSSNRSPEIVAVERTGTQSFEAEQAEAAVSRLFAAELVAPRLPIARSLAISSSSPKR